jgi:nucleoside-diphosphate-sugar epimerase
LALILVTGAGGFIGRPLCSGLVRRGHVVFGVTRGVAEPIPGTELRPIGDIGPKTDWSRHLAGVEIVIHLANRAHSRVPGGAGTNEAEAAAALAGAAAKAKVVRLLYMSSIRAMGDATPPGASFRSTDPALPRDAYGYRKLAIERALQAAAQETGLELVILRPPLVYGPGAKGNFRALIRLVASGLPLPFAGIDNRRSLVFLDNLVDLVARAIAHPGAVGRVLLARDAVDLSTPELIRLLAVGLDRRARLFTLPPRGFTPLRSLPLLGPLIARLTMSLQIDDTDTRLALDWRPPVSPEIAVVATARTFRERL